MLVLASVQADTFAFDLIQARDYQLATALDTFRIGCQGCAVLSGLRRSLCAAPDSIIDSGTLSRRAILGFYSTVPADPPRLIFQLRGGPHVVEIGGRVIIIAQTSHDLHQTPIYTLMPRTMKIIVYVRAGPNDGGKISKINPYMAAGLQATVEVAQYPLSQAAGFWDLQLHSGPTHDTHAAERAVVCGGQQLGQAVSSAADR